MNRVNEYITEGTPIDVIRRYESLPYIASVTDFGILDHNVVVLDTETTGLSFAHDELIQIAAAKLDKGIVVDRFNTYVKPRKPIPDEITHLTGITNEQVENAVSAGKALESLVEFVGNSLVVAHNVEFDKTFATNLPSGYQLLENTWIDSLDLSRIVLPRLKSHRLIDLVHAFDAPVSTHRADDDVEATCAIYRVLLAGITTMPRELVDYIGVSADEREWSTAFAFKCMAEQWDEIVRNAKFPVKDQSNSEDASKHVSRETCYSEETVSGRIKLDQETLQEISSPASTEPVKNGKAFSMYKMRSRRILSLPSKKAKEDADNLIGKLAYPNINGLQEQFSSEGLLGTIYKDYDAREEQRVMANAIAEALDNSENLIIEAGTGVGKSMAYLVPFVDYALENNITVGIATKTNSLLDQLVYKELPALSDAYRKHDGEKREITWTSLKGISHYPCLRKIAKLCDRGPSVVEVYGKKMSQAPSMAALLSYIEQTEFDDLDSLKIDYRVLPRYHFTTNSQECLRRKCPFFWGSCFVHGARRRAETADVVVTNHSLLFCDIAAEGGLLPPIRHWVIDEAHSSENEARSAFAETIDSEALLKIGSIVGDSAGSRNLFDRAERNVSRIEAEQLTLFFGLVAKAKKAGNIFAEKAADYCLRVKDLLYFDPIGRTRRGQSYEQVEIWINDEVRKTEKFSDLAIVAMKLIESADKLIGASSELVAYMEGIDEAVESQREIASNTIELKRLRNAVELIFDTHPDAYVYQATMHRKKDRKVDKVHASLLDVGEILNETLYARTHSIVYASATLTVGQKFDSFETAMGLNRSEYSTARTLLLGSSYDFDNNMIVYVVSDMPEPNDPSYAQALCDLLVATHKAQQGSMLTLFTNRREMENAYREVEPALKEDGLRLICQKYGLSVKGLRDEFLTNEHLSLFALKSFWEGFDAPGATLKGVIIPKLPFARPTDPLYCERAARDERAWWRYVLPKAVIETKQAAGRLIRKPDDRGVLILADRRLLTKSYGKTFLRSLQSRTVRVCTAEEIVSALEFMAKW